MANTATLTGTITVISTSNSSHTITITVSDDSGATIATTTATVATETGDYSISGLPAGDCKVKFTNPNLTTANESITISLSKPNHINATMSPKGLQF
jgi:hypothetical protein